MSVARTAARRRRQAQINFTHLAIHGQPPRPLYHRRDKGDLHASIERERVKAVRMAKAKGKKKAKNK